MPPKTPGSVRKSNRTFSQESSPQPASARSRRTARPVSSDDDHTPHSQSQTLQTPSKPREAVELQLIAVTPNEATPFRSRTARSSTSTGSESRTTRSKQSKAPAPGSDSDFGLDLHAATPQKSTQSQRSSKTSAPPSHAITSALQSSQSFKTPPRRARTGVKANASNSKANFHANDSDQSQVLINSTQEFEDDHVVKSPDPKSVTKRKPNTTASSSPSSSKATAAPVSTLISSTPSTKPPAGTPTRSIPPPSTPRSRLQFMDRKDPSTHSQTHPALQSPRKPANPPTASVLSAQTSVVQTQARPNPLHVNSTLQSTTPLTVSTAFNPALNPPSMLSTKSSMSRASASGNIASSIPNLTESRFRPLPSSTSLQSPSNPIRSSTDLTLGLDSSDLEDLLGTGSDADAFSAKLKQAQKMSKKTYQQPQAHSTSLKSSFTGLPMSTKSNPLTNHYQSSHPVHSASHFHPHTPQLSQHSQHSQHSQKTPLSTTFSSSQGLQRTQSKLYQPTLPLNSEEAADDGGDMNDNDVNQQDEQESGSLSSQSSLRSDTVVSTGAATNSKPQHNSQREQHFSSSPQHDDDVSIPLQKSRVAHDKDTMTDDVNDNRMTSATPSKPVEKSINQEVAQKDISSAVSKLTSSTGNAALTTPIPVRGRNAVSGKNAPATPSASKTPINSLNSPLSIPASSSSFHSSTVSTTSSSKQHNQSALPFGSLHTKSTDPVLAQNSYPANAQSTPSFSHPSTSLHKSSTTLLPPAHSSLSFSHQPPTDASLGEYQSMSQYDYNNYLNSFDSGEQPTTGLDFAAIFGSIHFPNIDNPQSQGSSNTHHNDTTNFSSSSHSSFSPRTATLLAQTGLTPKPPLHKPFDKTDGSQRDNSLDPPKPDSNPLHLQNARYIHHLSHPAHTNPIPLTPSHTISLSALQSHQQQLAALQLRLPPFQYHSTTPTQPSLAQIFAHPPPMLLDLDDTEDNESFTDPTTLHDKYQAALHRHGLEHLALQPTRATQAAQNAKQPSSAPISLADKLKSRQKNRQSIVDANSEGKSEERSDNGGDSVLRPEGQPASTVVNLRDKLASILNNAIELQQVENSTTDARVTRGIGEQSVDELNLSQLSSHHLSVLLKLNPTLQGVDTIRAALASFTAMPNGTSSTQTNVSNLPGPFSSTQPQHSHQLIDEIPTATRLAFQTDPNLHMIYKQLALQLLHARFKKAYPINTVSLDEPGVDGENDSAEKIAAEKEKVAKKATKNRRMTGHFKDASSKDQFLQSSQGGGNTWFVPKRENQIMVDDLADFANTALIPSIQEHNFNLISDQQQRVYLPTLGDQEREFSEKNPHLRPDPVTSTTSSTTKPPKASTTKPKKGVKGEDGGVGYVNPDSWKEIDLPGEFVEHFAPHHQEMIKQDWNPVFITEAAHMQKWTFLTMIPGGGEFPTLPRANVLNSNYNVMLAKSHSNISSAGQIDPNSPDDMGGDLRLMQLQRELMTSSDNPLTTQTIPSHYFSNTLSSRNTDTSSQIIGPKEPLYPEIHNLHRAPLMANALNGLSKQYAIVHPQHHFTPIPIGTSAIWESIQPDPLQPIIPFSTNDELYQMIYCNDADDDNNNMAMTDESSPKNPPRASGLMGMLSKMKHSTSQQKTTSPSLNSIGDVIRSFLKFFNLPFHNFRNPLTVQNYYEELKEKYSTSQRRKFAQLRHQINRRLSKLRLQHRYEIMGQQYVGNYIKPSVMNVINTLHAQSDPKSYTFDQYLNFVEQDQRSLLDDSQAHQSSVSEPQIAAQLDESRKSTYLLVNLHNHHAEVVGMSHELVELIPLSDINISFEQMSDPYYTYHQRQQELKRKKLSAVHASLRNPSISAAHPPESTRRLSVNTTPSSEKRRASGDLHAKSAALQRDLSSHMSATTSEATRFRLQPKSPTLAPNLVFPQQSGSGGVIDVKSPKGYQGNQQVLGQSGRLAQMTDEDSHSNPPPTHKPTSRLQQLQQQSPGSLESQSSLSHAKPLSSLTAALSVSTPTFSSNALQMQSRPSNNLNPLQILPPTNTTLHSGTKPTSKTSEITPPKPTKTDHPKQSPTLPPSSPVSPQNILNTSATKRNARSSLQNLPQTPHSDDHQDATTSPRVQSPPVTSNSIVKRQKISDFVQPAANIFTSLTGSNSIAPKLPPSSKRSSLTPSNPPSMLSTTNRPAATSTSSLLIKRPAGVALGQTNSMLAGSRAGDIASKPPTSATNSAKSQGIMKFFSKQQPPP